MPAVNSEVMAEHLTEISSQVATAAHAVLVCNGTGWHQPGARLAIPDNITLQRLPGYAPVLNPVENIWGYLRGSKLSKRVWGSYEAPVSQAPALPSGDRTPETLRG